jgi:hypothetical protein
MNTNIGLGPAIPFGSALPRAPSAVEFYGDHRRNKSAREDHRGEPKPFEPLPPRGAPMKGPLPGPVITPLEAAAIEARQARTAGAAQAVAVPDMSQVLSMLTALQADLDALKAIPSRMDALEARLDTLDGAL